MVFRVGALFLALSLTACGLTDARRKKSERASLHMQMAVSLMSNNKLPEALSELNIAEQLTPSNPEIQSYMGIVYQLRNRPAEAEKRFRRALELEPKYTDVRTNLARLYIDQGRYKDALKEIGIVENDLTYPAPEKALLLKGMAFHKMGDFKRAEPVLIQSYQTQRESCLGSYFLGRNYYDQKKMKDAAQILDQAITNCKNSKFEEPLFYASMSHYELGDKSQARARAEELVEKYPKSPLAPKANALLKILEEL